MPFMQEQLTAMYRMYGMPFMQEQLTAMYRMYGMPFMQKQSLNSLHC